jgi:Phosphotransferase enzyme family
VRDDVLERGVSSRDLLGDGRPRDDELMAIVRDALRRPNATIVDWRVETVPYEIGTPFTEGLFRVRGIASDGEWVGPWSLFVKLVRSWRHWPMLHVMPEHIREAMLQHPGWRKEPDIYDSDLSATLPAGLAMPRVLRVHDLGDERVALWLEDVAASDARWDLARFRHAARLLGQLAARMTAEDALPETIARDTNEMVHDFYESRLAAYAFPLLQSDATWSHPAVASVVDEHLRSDLLELAERLPAMIARLDRIPHAVIHGDACPQNLLIPAQADVNGFVVIDWGMACSAPVGYELAQLLIGLAHSGELTVEELPAVHDAILDAYIDGLTDEGHAVNPSDVQFGFDAGLVLRSAFTSLPLEQLVGPDSDALAALIAQRVRLTRYLVDLGLTLSDGG